MCKQIQDLILFWIESAMYFCTGATTTLLLAMHTWFYLRLSALSTIVSNSLFCHASSVLLSSFYTFYGSFRLFFAIPARRLSALSMAISDSLCHANSVLLSSFCTFYGSFWLSCHASSVLLSLCRFQYTFWLSLLALHARSRCCLCAVSTTVSVSFWLYMLDYTVVFV